MATVFSSVLAQEGASLGSSSERELDILLTQYVNEVQLLAETQPTDKQWLALNQQWLQKMQVALFEFPLPSAKRTGVLGVALSLANTLEQNDLAEDFAGDLYEAVKKHRGSRVWALRIQAEVAMKRSRLEEDVIALQRAKKYLLKALFESEPEWWSELKVLGHLRERLLCTDLLGQCLTDLDDHPGAAVAFGRGASEVPAILSMEGANSKRRLVRDVEYFTQQEAFAWARGGMGDQVLVSVNRIVDHQGLRQPPSVYVNSAARIFAEAGGSYSALVKTWIESTMRDEWTAALEVLLASDMVQRGKSDEAMTVLLRLYANQMDELERIDESSGPTAVRMNVGYAPTMLMNLVTLLRASGRNSEAEEVFAKLLSEYPNSPYRLQIVN
ncbi:MAG: hypothetical protein HOC27_08060 [Phycisphaerae bacterium]|nr:hypothetical protein [Phycisphaerae bacterium]